GLRAVGLRGFFAGVLFTLSHLAVAVASCWGIGAVAAAIHPRLLDLSCVFFVYSSIALRGLCDHAPPVSRALAKGHLGAARTAVQRIVGRDASLLDAAGVARAAVESVAEGFVDGFFSPFFWSATIGFLALAAGSSASRATLAAATAAFFY